MHSNHIKNTLRRGYVCSIPQTPSLRSCRRIRRPVVPLHRAAEGCDGLPNGPTICRSLRRAVSRYGSLPNDATNGRRARRLAEACGGLPKRTTDRCKVRQAVSRYNGLPKEITSCRSLRRAVSCYGELPKGTFGASSTAVGGARCAEPGKSSSLNSLGRGRISPQRPIGSGGGDGHGHRRRGRGGTGRARSLLAPRPFSLSTLMPDSPVCWPARCPGPLGGEPDWSCGLS